MSTMEYTRHAKERTWKRCLPQDVLELAYAEGMALCHSMNRYLLTRSQVHSLQKDNIYPPALLQKAEKTAPVAVVVVNNRVITAFRPTRRINFDWRTRV